MQIDQNAGTWRTLTKHLNERLQSLYERLSMKQNEADTNFIRGEISMLKEVLALPEQMKQQEAQLKQQQPVDYEGT